MKRFIIFISLHLFLLLLVFTYQVKADEEEWTIDKYKSLSYARVSGEVIHGDNLNFFIGSNENCEKVYNSFTFVTYEKPSDIFQLEGKNILPIRVRSGDKRYVLIKGLHTLEALKALGEEEIEGFLTRAQLH